MNTVNFLNLEYILLRITDFFKNFDIVAILNGFIYFINVIMPYMIVLAVIFVIINIYIHIKVSRVLKGEEEKWRAGLIADNPAEPHHDAALEEKWRQVQTHINSDNQSDWRLAILEADIMLDDVLEKMGYQGDSIGDKLKGVEKSDFLTLDDAWEAHKVRNQIAHEGTDFKLDQREAKRVIELFKKVFDEFYYI